MTNPTPDAKVDEAIKGLAVTMPLLDNRGVKEDVLTLVIGIATLRADLANERELLQKVEKMFYSIEAEDEDGKEVYWYPDEKLENEDEPMLQTRLPTIRYKGGGVILTVTTTAAFLAGILFGRWMTNRAVMKILTMPIDDLKKLNQKEK